MNCMGGFLVSKNYWANKMVRQSGYSGKTSLSQVLYAQTEGIELDFHQLTVGIVAS